MSAAFQTYLINLDRAPQRLAFMDEQLTRLAIPYTRIAGIDGKTITPPHPDLDLTAYRQRHGRKFHPGEVGCYFSHLKAIDTFLEEALETGETHALILEDDARLPDDLSGIIAAALEHEDEWDLLRLSTVNDGIRIPYRALGNGRHLAIALTREKGAAAYMISRRCAQKLTRALRPMSLAYDIAFDIEYLFGLRSVFVEPPPVDQTTDQPSQIQHFNRESKLPASRYLTVFPWRVWFETTRFTIRGTRLVKAWLARGRKPDR